MKRRLAILAAVAVLAPAVAEACPTGCCFYAIADPIRIGQTAQLVSAVTTATQLYSLGNTIFGHVNDSMGGKGAISSGPPTASLEDAAVDVSPISAIGAAPTPNLTTQASAEGWVASVLFSPDGSGRNLGLVASRRSETVILAGQHGLAAAEASRVALPDAAAEAQAALVQGDQAANVREQVAALMKTVDLVRAELLSLQRVEAAITELRAAKALRVDASPLASILPQLSQPAPASTPAAPPAAPPGNAPLPQRAAITPEPLARLAVAYSRKGKRA
ncbi:MAG: hypothetical protein M0006_15410 [Magnetospirillum sp.]|nr:hypothetical protein [Magnetospirillum sp.]